jgi:hypothetical protein
LPGGSKDRGGCTPSGNSGYWPDTRSEPDAINSRPASLLCTGSGELIPDSAGRYAAAESTILGLDPIVLRGRRQRDGLPVIYSYQRSAEGVAVRLSGTAKGVLAGASRSRPASSNSSSWIPGWQSPVHGQDQAQRRRSRRAEPSHPARAQTRTSSRRRSVRSLVRGCSG